MAIYINKAIIMGRLGADPELRAAGVVVLRVATTETWRDKATGDKQERTQWHNVVIFSDQPGRFLVEYGHKGDLVYIEGQIETRKWERDGLETKFYTEIVVRPFSGSVQLMSKQGRDEASEPEERQAKPKPENRSTAQGPTNKRSSRLDDDEIPFAPEWR